MKLHSEFDKFDKWEPIKQSLAKLSDRDFSDRTEVNRHMKYSYTVDYDDLSGNYSKGRQIR